MEQKEASVDLGSSLCEELYGPTLPLLQFFLVSRDSFVNHADSIRNRSLVEIDKHQDTVANNETS